MLTPPQIIVPFLATFAWYWWQYRLVDPGRRGLNVVAGHKTRATVGALGDPLWRRHTGRVWRVSRWIVRISVASSAGTYCLLRRLAPRETA